MVTDPPRNRMKLVRTLLWLLVVVAVAATAAMFLARRDTMDQPSMQHADMRPSLGGPFTLVGADGKPFSSQSLEGKPYLIFFGFTRCGDVCPTTLGRLIKLREQANAAKAIPIVFVTIDPKNDGPKEVGQYAELFGSPIIGLTGSEAQIDAVKKQYGIYAEPVPHAAAGQEMQHTSTVLLFDRSGTLQSTISPGEDDGAALDKIRRAIS